MNKPRILVVEDEVIVGRDICQQLQDLDYEPVAHVRKGEEAITQARQLRPNLVLMDINLAGQMDGIASAQVIREQLGIPVIFLTAFAGGETLSRAKLADPFGYIVKPFEERELHTAIELALYKHRSETALRDSERFRQLLLDSVSEGIYGIDVEGVCTFANRACLRLLGYDRESDLLGRKIRDIIRPSATSGSPTPESRLAPPKKASASSHVSSDVFLRRDGSLLPVEHWSHPMRVEGHIIGSVVTFVDITERKRADERLRLQSGALEAAANGIVITSATGEIEWANPAFTHCTGYTLAEAAGKNPRDLLKSDKHDPAFYRNMWRTILAGEVWHGELINRRKDGTLYNEEMTITPMRDPHGVITHFIAVKQDISHRKSLEAQFRQAQKMEAIGQLAGGVAHDFNNILAAVMLHLGLLQDEPALDSNTRSALRDLEKEIHRGVGLTRQLLAFSRQQAMESKPLDANGLIGGLLKMLRRLLGEHIVIQLREHKNIPLVEADAGMIEQVLINLCVNARDAMPRGGQITLRTEDITIEALDDTSHSEARPGRFLRVSVSDTGCGMDEQTLQKIFEPFFTTKAVGKGTGLGLATVYGIVKQHRGWVEVRSTPGQGTTFHVYLPAHVKQEENPEDETAAPARPPRGHGETILLAEDEPSVRAITGTTLRRHGYDVIEASNGPDAVRLWDSHRDRIKLLLTDMMMPGGMNGRELADALRAKQPALKVIVCTGYSQMLAKENFPANLQIDLLRKPSSPSQLLSAVRTSLDRG